ncbi:hypothetical protein [uncultured Nocardioides sp.]|uniref:hypothetical protein n=1 Tax=uncultured Nocardioides sp. TaxID=198441 RepID=UPI002613B4B9|nr:hypothetical protein [uncultured Nocardioides sp.]
MRRTTATVLTVLTTLGALAATMAPASAEVVTVEDGINDVQYFSGRDLGIRTDYVDISSTTVDHRANNIVMTVGILDVDKTTDFEVQGALKTGGRLYLARLQYAPGGSNVFLQDGDTGDELRCAVKGAVKEMASTVVLTVPRSCVGDPARVRFGSRTIDAGDGFTLIDDGRRGRVTSQETPIKVGRATVAQG